MLASDEIALALGEMGHAELLDPGPGQLLGMG